TAAVDYGSWWHYSFRRLSGLTMQDNEGVWEGGEIRRSTPGNIRLTSFPDRRDRQLFAEAYADPESGITVGKQGSFPTITGPIDYIGQQEIDAAIQLLRQAAAKVGHENIFVPALSPGSAERLKNEHYDNENDVIFACAEAMGQEYKAITDAGFTVQIDDPSLAENWDQINPEPAIEDYCAFIRVRVDAINHALKKYAIPREQTRLHICWGSWHGPHVTD